MYRYDVNTSLICYDRISDNVILKSNYIIINYYYIINNICSHNFNRQFSHFCEGYLEFDNIHQLTRS